MASRTRLPARGDFGHKTVVGAFEPDLEGALHTAAYFGLPNYCTWIYGLMRDEQGTMYNWARTVYGLEVSVQYFFNTNRDGGQLRMYIPPTPEEAFAFGPLSCRVEGDEHVMESIPSVRMFELAAPGMQFSCRRRVDSIEYREGETVVLSGRRVGPGLQYYVPSGGFYFTSTQHRADGVFLGEKVRGFIFFDQLYLPPGVSWTTGPYINNGVNTIELAWNPFANEYEDGSIEWGHLCYGADGFNFAMVANEREATLLSSNVDLEAISYNADGFPEHVAYVVDGNDAWEWELDARGELVDFAGGSSLYRAAEGRMFRRGDGRAPAVWTSWQSSYPDSIGAWQKRTERWKGYA